MTTTTTMTTRAALTIARDAHSRARRGDLLHTDETRAALETLTAASSLSWNPSWRAQINAAMAVLNILL